MADMKIFSVALFLTGLFVLPACASRSQSQAVPERIVAVGDLHGDFDATRRALRLAGAIDAQDNWSGGSLVLVQTGDQLDRGDQEVAILALFEKISAQAEQAGGKVYVLNGNHEIMNVQGDFRYVSQLGFKRFAELHLSGQPSSLSLLSKMPDFAKPRAAAFLPGGPYALKLAERQSVLVLGDTVFAHGGVHPAHVDYGIDKLNQDYQNWLKGQLPALPELLTNDQSPIWSRAYSSPQTAPDCVSLKQTLTKMGLKRMVLGHSVQKKINSACDNQVWRIDVGMAKSYGGPIQVLEIQGSSLRVLEENRP
jgi:hypothetical protein